MRVCPDCKERTDERQCPRCRITTVDEASLTGADLVGRVFADRFDVVSVLGRGGMGTVYLARHIAMDSRVALKVLRREVAGDLEAIERFYREARAASRLQQSHTIKVFDFGQSEDGQLYLAMEYLDGISLRAEMRQSGPMEEERILRIAEQVALSLGEAHQKGIVHRDVKPENIVLARMYGAEDFVKVLDFGVARTPGGENLTRTGLAVGTPAYMSPEQARGEHVDGRSDLYSLGVLMFEMAAGAPPFESTTPMALMLMHINDAPPRLEGPAHPNVRPAFADLVQSLLAKSRDDRPADAAALIARIAALRSGVAMNRTGVMGTPRSVLTTADVGGDVPARAGGHTPAMGSPVVPPPPDPGAEARPTVRAQATPPTRPSPHAAPGSRSDRPPLPGSIPGPAFDGLPDDADRDRSGGRAAWIVALVLVLAGLGGTGAWLGLGGLETLRTQASGTEATPDAALSKSEVVPSAAAPQAPSPVATPAPAIGPAARPPAPPPPAPPEPSSARGTLVVQPAAALIVTLPDGRDLGRSPAAVELQRGATMRVRIAAPGYRDRDLSLSFDDVARSPEVRVDLEKKPAPRAAPARASDWDL